MKEKFNKARNGIVQYLRDEEAKGSLKMSHALAAYFQWQFTYNEKKKPKEERLDEDTERLLCSTCACLVDNIPTMEKNLNRLVEGLKEKDVCPDFYVHMVYEILGAFDIDNKKEGAEDDELWIDVNNKIIHHYLVGFIGLCVRIIHDKITDPLQFLNIMENDDLDNPFHDCTRATPTYEYVKKEYGLGSTDYILYCENIDNIENSEEYHMSDEQCLEHLHEFGNIMKEIMPMMCGTTISGCKTDEEQTAFKKRLHEMINEPDHVDNLTNLFVAGVLFVGLLPEGLDVKSRLSSHEECMNMFGAWYETFGGERVKKYFDPLPDEDKRVARTAWLSGLLYTLIKNATTNGEYLPQGMMFKPI